MSKRKINKAEEDAFRKALKVCPHCGEEIDSCSTLSVYKMSSFSKRSTCVYRMKCFSCEFKAEGWSTDPEHVIRKFKQQSFALKLKEALGDKAAMFVLARLDFADKAERVLRAIAEEEHKEHPKAHKRDWNECTTHPCSRIRRWMKKYSFAAGVAEKLIGAKSVS